MGGTLAVNREEILAGGIFNAVKSARAPRRLENVRERRVMFYPGRGDGGTAAAKYGDDSSASSEEENFGWRPNDREITVSSGRSRRRATIRRSSSRESSPSRVDSDNPDDRYSFARNASKQEPESGICERIELSSLTRDDDLDIDLIEKDALETWSDSAANDSEDESREESRTVCYTPERLIRSQEYRILVPSPRCFILPQPRFTPENGSSRKYRRCRKRLSCLIDSKQIGATQLRMLLNLPIARTRAASSPIFGRERRVVGDHDDHVAPSDDPLGARRSTGTISSSSSRSSCDIVNSTWDYDCKGLTVRPLSLDDTSGIQSNDWSLETRSDTPMCLCDELAVASRSRLAAFANDRGTAVSEVASEILESLRSDPENATTLHKGDRFRNGTSSHDRLTRPVVETDAATIIPDDPNNWMHRLRDKIKRLRLANKELHRDVRDLCTDFQREEEKTMSMSNSARHLLQDVYELRYLDDLLKLMKGSLSDHNGYVQKTQQSVAQLLRDYRL